MPERTARWSLHNRLPIIAALAAIATLIGCGTVLYLAAQRQDAAMLDARLEDLAKTVLSFAEHEIHEILESGRTDMVHIETEATLGSRYRYQIWDKGGALRLRSPSASATAPMLPLGQLGLVTAHLDGVEFRVVARNGDSGTMIIQMAEQLDGREPAIGVLGGYLLGLLLMPFVLVFGGTWMMLRSSLGSIDAMADQLRHRNPLDLTPVQLHDPPRELLPIVRSIDTLFARVGHALSVERRFTSVAAHEMRTPLAGLRAHAQLAINASSRDELQDALAAVMLGVDRAAHLLEQLLDLARIEAFAGDASAGQETVCLSELYQELMDELGPRGTRKGQVFAARFAVPMVNGHRFALSLLLRNLIANAVHYAPQGARIEVSSALDGGDVLLCVDDSGPGIAAQDRERAFERFNRLGRTEVGGVGLGLSIVLSVVELHGARMQLLNSPLGGLRAQVRFAPGVLLRQEASLPAPPP